MSERREPVTVYLGDFLDELERELVVSRRDLARQVDRTQALADLRTRALSVSAALKREITVEDVFSSAKDEKERAELRALVDRIAPPVEEDSRAA
jgi:hypothetical protein